MSRLVRSLEGPFLTRVALWGAFLFGLICVLYLFAPFFKALFLGAIFASLLLPLHRFLVHRWRFPPPLSSFGITLLVVLILSLFITAFAWILIPQLLHVFQTIEGILSSPDQTKELLESMNRWLNPLGIEAEKLFEFLRSRFISEAYTIVQKLSLTVQKIVLFATGVIGDFLVMIFSLYLFILYGSQIKKFVDHFSPLPSELREQWIDQFRSLIRAFFLGGVGTAVIQGGIASIGYLIVGLPSVPALFVLTAVASFIPFLGTALVWGPVVVYFFLIGQIGKGIFLLIFCLGIVATIDQWIKPLFFGTALNLPVMIMFLAILGGIKSFGLLGVILGPLILSYFLSLTRVLMETSQPLSVTTSPKEES